MKTVERKRLSESEIEQLRFQALEMIRAGAPHKEIATAFHISKRTVRKWSTLYRRGGEEALHVKGAFHRPSKLSEEQKQQLITIITEGAAAAGFDTDLWTCPRIVRLIEERFGVHYHVDYLPTLLHDLGFSPQKPQKADRKRDEARITGWVRTDWREIKKKPDERMR